MAKIVFPESNNHVVVQKTRRRATTHTDIKKDSKAPPQPGLSHTSADQQVRERYLSRLGIPPKTSPKKKISPPCRSRRYKQSTEEKLPLKKDDHHAAPCPTPRTVCFEDSVTAISIPTRTAYSPRVQKAYWGNRTDNIFSARRNAIEFEAEGRDWHSVTEENEMLAGPNDELIHPIHLLHQMRRDGVQHQFLAHRFRQQMQQ